MLAKLITPKQLLTRCSYIAINVRVIIIELTQYTVQMCALDSVLENSHNFVKMLVRSFKQSKNQNNKFKSIIF